MSNHMANVIPLRSAGARKKIDLALAVALLNKGVKAHERARRARIALLARLAFHPVGTYSHAKPLGA